MAGTTSKELEGYAQRHIGRSFLGVFAADMLPRNTPSICSLIVNLDPISGVLLHNRGGGSKVRHGSHWVAIKLRGAGLPALFGDSYGHPPSSSAEGKILHVHDHFKKWLNRHAPAGYVYNHLRIQAWGSNVCGLYSLYFCRYGIPSTQPAAFAWVTDDRKRNDTIIRGKIKL